MENNRFYLFPQFQVTIPPPSASPGSNEAGSNGPKEGEKGGEGKPSNNIAASFAAQVYSRASFSP